MKKIRPSLPSVARPKVASVLAGLALAVAARGQVPPPAAATPAASAGTTSGTPAPGTLPTPTADNSRPPTSFTGTVPVPRPAPTGTTAPAVAIPPPIAVPGAVTGTTTPAPAGGSAAAALPVPSTAAATASTVITPTAATATPGAAPTNPPTARPLALPGNFPKPATNQTAATRPGILAQPAATRPGATPPRPGTPPPAAGVPATQVPGTGPNTAEVEENNALVERIKNLGDLDEYSEALKIKNMTLDQFLEIYAKASRRIVLRGQGLNGQLQLTLVADRKLPREVILQAFDSVLALNLIATVPQGDEFVLVIPSQTAQNMGKPFSTNAPSGYNEAFQYVTHIVQVKHAEVKEAVEVMAKFASAQNAQGIVALESTKTIVLRDYQANVKRMLEVLQKIDVHVEDDYTLEVIPIKYGKVEEIYSTLSSVIGGGGGAGAGLGRQSPNANRRNTTRSSSTRSSASYGAGSAGAGGYGGYNYNSFEPQPVGSANNPAAGVGLNYNSFEPQQSSITPIGGANTRTGSGFQQRLNGVNRAGGAAGAGGAFAQLLETTTITPDERSNSLIVYGTKKDIAKLKEVIAKVDTLQAQVMIEGIIMEVSLTDGLNYGLSAGQQPKNFGGNPAISGGGSVNGNSSLNNVGNFLGGGSTTNGVFSTGGGLSYLTRIGSRWDVTLNAIASDSRVNIIQQPRIQTTHATEARFFVGSTVPFQQGSYFGGGLGVANSYYQRQDVGIDLTVTPYITPDGLVTMEVQQVIEEIAPGSDTAAGTVPTTNKREANSTVSVMTGESILLGGYIRNSRSDGKSGVPILKDIPFLGKAFSSNSRNGARTELLVLMHPTVLATPKEASEMAATSRAESAPLRQLDFEIKASEDARKKDIEKMEKRRKSSWWR